MVGRGEERSILRELLGSKEAEFVTVIGRRRIGKTYLIRHTYEQQMAFEVTGIQDASRVEQLANFQFALRQYFSKYQEIKPLENWIDAFTVLISLLKKQKKKVVFIDELPWIATHRSGFLKGLSFFWNSWASKNKIVLVTCGSAASWMIQKIILDKGGLHNRVTRQIILQPFTLTETKEYLSTREIELSHYQIVQLYMVLGGVAYYLKLVPKGKSIGQIITYLFLKKNAPLRHEFDNLYKSLFSHPDRYISIIEACHTKWKGVNHDQLATLSKLPSGGSLTRMIYELEISGFVETTQMIGAKRKNTTIRVVDEFSIFYLKYIRPHKYDTWQSIMRSSSFTSWQGFAYENICLKHISQIKKALGIAGVTTRNYSLYTKGSEKIRGAQIDLIIDRDDHIVNLCEIKFYNKQMVLTKAMMDNIANKEHSLQQYVSPKQSIHLTIISTFGVKPNKYSGRMQSEVVLDDLF